MTKMVAQQQISPRPDKKDTPVFSYKNAENVLELAEKLQILSAQKRENALELARAVCIFANAGLPDETGTDAGREKQRQRLAAADELLKKEGWLDERVHILAYLLADSRGFPEELLDVANEYRQIAKQLASVNTYGFVLEQRQAFFCRMDASTGQVKFDKFTLLGPYQDVLKQALSHRGIDARRFKRCVACNAFFYQPRRKSRACSRKCEDVLMSREHYEREKNRRQQARELRAEGKTIFEIAAALKLPTKKVRPYIAEGEVRDGAQKERG